MILSNLAGDRVLILPSMAWSAPGVGEHAEGLLIYNSRLRNRHPAGPMESKSQHMHSSLLTSCTRHLGLAARRKELFMHTDNKRGHLKHLSIHCLSGNQGCQDMSRIFTKGSHNNPHAYAAKIWMQRLYCLPTEEYVLSAETSAIQQCSMPVGRYLTRHPSFRSWRCMRIARQRRQQRSQFLKKSLASIVLNLHKTKLQVT